MVAGGPPPAAAEVFAIEEEYKRVALLLAPSPNPSRSIPRASARPHYVFTSPVCTHQRTRLATSRTPTLSMMFARCFSTVRTLQVEPRCDFLRGKTFRHQPGHFDLAGGEHLHRFEERFSVSLFAPAETFGSAACTAPARTLRRHMGRKKHSPSIKDSTACKM